MPQCLFVIEKLFFLDSKHAKFVTFFKQKLVKSKAPLRKECSMAFKMNGHSKLSVYSYTIRVFLDGRQKGY